MAALALDDIRRGMARDPFLYPQNLSIARGELLFIRLGREEMAAASFLDDRILTPHTAGRWVGFREVEALLRDSGLVQPLHFIFHAGHVGSTLISRLLDETGVVLGLREPLPLRVLAEVFDEAGAPHALVGEPLAEALLRWCCVLWSRGYSDTRAVVVKATSSASRLARRLMQTAPASRALFLALKAESYLATLLAGGNSHIDLRGHGPERFRRLARLGAPPKAPLAALSLGELAALTWLAETLTERAAAREHRDRVLALDFDDFLDDPRVALGAITAHFGLGVSAKALDQIAESALFSRYSKAPDTPYSPAMRRQILAEARTRHGEEIRRGLVWLEEAARASPTVAQALSA